MNPLLLGKHVVKRFLPPPPELPLDMTELEKQIFSLVEPYTMTSLERVITLVRAVQYAVNLEGT